MLNTKGFIKPKVYNDIINTTFNSSSNDEFVNLIYDKNINTIKNNIINKNENNIIDKIENNIIDKIQDTQSIDTIFQNTKLNTIPEKIATVIDENKKDIYFDENINSYIINFNNKTHTISNTEIFNSITNNKITDTVIEDFIFNIMNIDNIIEYKFINNTTFSNDIDMLFKLQNFIYDIIINSTFQNNDIDTQNSLILFYYHLIIFMFKTPFNIKYDTNKINNIFSKLSYRFASIILKQNEKLQIQCNNINSKLNKLNNDKDNLHTKINLINEKFDAETSTPSSITNNTSNTTDDILKSTTSLNITNSTDDILKSTTSLNITNSKQDNSQSIDNNNNCSNLVNTVISSTSITTEELKEKFINNSSKLNTEIIPTDTNDELTEIYQSINIIPKNNLDDISNIDDKNVQNIEIDDDIKPILINNINDNDFKLLSVGNSKLNNTYTFDKTFFINK